VDAARKATFGYVFKEKANAKTKTPGPGSYLPLTENKNVPFNSVNLGGYLLKERSF